MRDSTTIRSVGDFNYCPLCGSKVDKREERVGTFKYNLVVECPNHGVLIKD